MCLFYQSLHPGQQGTSHDQEGEHSRSVHHLECYIRLGSNFRSNERACEIPSKTLPKKIAGYVTQLKRIQRGPVGVFSIKLQEEESEEGQLCWVFFLVFLLMILYSMCESPSELCWLLSILQTTFKPKNGQLFWDIYLFTLKTDLLIFWETLGHIYKKNKDTRVKPS